MSSVDVDRPDRRRPSRDADSLARARRRDDSAALATRIIALLDEQLNRQVNAILHHPRFQQLEASWRGLAYLIEQVADAGNVRIRLLNMAWSELARDMERAMEFDQSQLFQKVYSDEFGMPGGEPYGLLIGDYAIQPRPAPGHPTDDMATLAKVTDTAAAAFAPFIAAAHPSLFGLDGFADLERPLDLSYNFRQAELVRWRSLRESDDARFLGLVLPRVLVRLPYPDDGSRSDGFRFREDVSAPAAAGYLWGNAVYAFGAVVVRAFVESGWLADIRGVQADVDGGGLVPQLPSPSLATDAPGLLCAPSTEVIITDDQEKELTELGFIPLCHCRDTEYAAFYSNQSVQSPMQYDALPARINARLSAMLQYILCAARFAHYLKVMARDMVGSFLSAADCQRKLQKWLSEYVSGDVDATASMKARYPLSEGRVEVRDHPGHPGSYLSTFYLRPHYQLDELVASFRLVSELSASSSSGGRR